VGKRESPIDARVQPAWYKADVRWCRRWPESVERRSTSSWGRDWSLAYLLDMKLLYHSFVQCLRTVRKNDTLTYFGFGLRVGSPIFWGLFNSFRASGFACRLCQNCQNLALSICYQNCSKKFGQMVKMLKLSVRLFSEASKRQAQKERQQNEQPKECFNCRCNCYQLQAK
jgi:hypothetical protein